MLYHIEKKIIILVYARNTVISVITSEFVDKNDDRQELRFCQKVWLIDYSSISIRLGFA